jgi:hypothetical protein
MAEGSELLATPQASFYYRKALIDGTDLLPLPYYSIRFFKCQVFCGKSDLKQKTHQPAYRMGIQVGVNKSLS